MNTSTQYPSGPETQGAPGSQPWTAAPQPYPQAPYPQAGQVPYQQTGAVPPAQAPIQYYTVPAPAAGYAQPQFQPGYYGQPMPVAAPAYAAVPAPYYAPPFAIGGTRAPKDPRRAGASKTLNRMCLLVLGQTALAYFWQIIFLAVMTATGTNIYTNGMAYLWLTAALVPLSTALPFLLYLIFSRADFTAYLRFEKVGFFGGALCVLGGLAICLLANYPSFAIQDFFSSFGYSSATDVFAQADTWPAIILELLSTAVLVPVMEEFAFRGVLLSALRKYGIGFSIVASALVFSLVHMDFPNVVFALIAGLVFGFLYAKTNNLWLTILIHALNNGIAVLTSHTDFIFGDMAYVADNSLMLVPIAIGVLALIILFFFKRDMFIRYLSPRYDGPQRPLQGGESALAIVRAPLFWVIFAMMAFYTFALFL